MNMLVKGEVLYNGRNAQARDLAAWWENHELLDKERDKLLKAEKKKTKLIASAYAKLTPAEIDALGLVRLPKQVKK